MSNWDKVLIFSRLLLSHFYCMSKKHNMNLCMYVDFKQLLRIICTSEFSKINNILINWTEWGNRWNLGWETRCGKADSLVTRLWKYTYDKNKRILKDCAFTKLKDILIDIFVHATVPPNLWINCRWARNFFVLVEILCSGQSHVTRVLSPLRNT